MTSLCCFWHEKGRGNGKKNCCCLRFPAVFLGNRSRRGGGGGGGGQKVLTEFVNDPTIYEKLQSIAKIDDL